MTGTSINLLLAALFVLLGALNVSLILHASRALTKSRMSQRLIQAHRCGESSSIRSMIEDQDSIVVSGNKDQQRDAVLANFARYHNVLEMMERPTH
jgi:hypothetical protein